MELCLEHLMAEERELSISVDTLTQTEQALKRLDGLESNAQVSVSHRDCNDSLLANNGIFLTCFFVGSIRK